MIKLLHMNSHARRWFQKRSISILIFRGMIPNLTCAFLCWVETTNFVICIIEGTVLPSYREVMILISHYKDPYLPTTGFSSHCSLPATLPASCRYMMHHPFAWLFWHVSKYAEEGKLHEKDNSLEVTLYKTNSSPLKRC